MAITVRKGNESQFDINKMLPGEFAVTTDTYKVYVCMAAGVSKELASVEELQNILGASEEAFRAFQELLNAMESDSVITGLLSDINSIKSGEYTISFSEAEERSNIENTDTIKVILGKIRKFFSSFSAVAFSGKYADLSDKPTLGDAASKSVANNMTTSTAGTHVADAYQVKLLKGQLDEQNTKIEKDLSWSPAVLLTSNFCNTKIGEYEYVSIPTLSKYQEVEVCFRVGDFLSAPIRINRGGLTTFTYSAYSSVTYNGKITINVDFANNRIGLYTAIKTGWDFTFLSITSVKGMKLV